MPHQNKTNVEFNDHFYRSRLRALQAVDEMVDGLMSRLDSYGLLDNTYIFYTTDNGYHIGQHRLQPGKQCPFEEDINIPFMVRGPGVPRGAVSDEVSSHTDLAPTFLHLAGAKLRDDFDGEPMQVLLEATEKTFSSSNSQAADSNGLNRQTSISDKNKDSHSTRRPHRIEHVNVESWGIIMAEGIYGSELHPNHTYEALRLIGEDYNLHYTVWCSGEHELYDLNVRPTASKLPSPVHPYLRLKPSDP